MENIKQFTKIIYSYHEDPKEKEIWNIIHKISRKNCVVLLTTDDYHSYLIKSIGSDCDLCDEAGVFINPMKLKALIEWCEQHKYIIKNFVNDGRIKPVRTLIALHNSIHLNIEDVQIVKQLENEYVKEELSSYGRIYKNFNGYYPDKGYYLNRKLF